MSASPPTASWKAEFSRFLEATGGLLHFAAHSHHFWLDATYEAQKQAWHDAARHVDRKWGRAVFSEVVPTVQGHIAGHLGLQGDLRDGSSIAFAGNTHEFCVRLLSCFEHSPVRILSTDGEFHSFQRQSARWEEAGLVVVERVAVEPFDTFDERFLERADSLREELDMVFLSHVFFGSGFVFHEFEELAKRLRRETFLVADGYHSFLALPLDWSGLQDRAFYMSGGYKYAMAGEGCCFLHCPPGYGERPVNTGWYAEFGALENPREERVAYAESGQRFAGATFDPTGIYRLRAVFDRLAEICVDANVVHEHVRGLQRQLLDAVEGGVAGSLRPAMLRPDEAFEERGHFLTFQRPDAADYARRLRDAGVLTDVRGDRVRFGFGLYQDRQDVDGLVGRLQDIA